MKEKNILDRILGARTKVKVVRLFVKKPPTFKASGREIARLIKVSAPYAHVSLKELYREGILKREEISRLHIYSLNHNNRIVKEILKPAFKREGVLKSK